MVTCAIRSRASKFDIDQLAEGLERCREGNAPFLKLAVAAGGICIMAYFLGIRLDPTIVIGALAAIIGGVVVFGLKLELLQSRPRQR